MIATHFFLWPIACKIEPFRHSTVRQDSVFHDDHFQHNHSILGGIQTTKNKQERFTEKSHLPY